ncbi:NAD-dependent protein deacetylase of SIR2 family [Micrococcales bacterium 31B]|nr:NAD-dependent protein deacetylase of SIR2 family [Micrococcales bacterium 31B]
MSRHQQGVRGELAEAAALEALRTADRVLFAAGAGLSAAAGYDYADRKRFAELFPALRRAGFEARYQMIGYPLPPRNQWGFWAVHVTDIRLGAEPNPLYQSLRAIAGDRDHFVTTSNVDCLFTRNGFDADRAYTPQGDYALYQCLTPCTREVWDARPIIERALAELDVETGATSAEAVPACPRCGGEVYLNVNGGRWYVNDHFMPGLERLRDWLGECIESDARVALLEFGAGFNTPSVVRWPVEQLAEQIPGATLIRVNADHPEVPARIAARSASVSGDAAEFIARAAAGGVA